MKAAVKLNWLKPIEPLTLASWLRWRSFVYNKRQATLWGEVQPRLNLPPCQVLLCCTSCVFHYEVDTSAGGLQRWAVAGSHDEPRSQSVGGQEMGFIRPTRRDAAATTPICAAFVIWGEPVNWFSWYCCNCCRRLSNDWGTQLTTFYYCDLGAEKTTATTQSCRTPVPTKSCFWFDNAD